jgi:hypothetical protein
LLLLLPSTLYCAFYGRVTWMRLLGVAGFVALSYVTLVGFTRATYAAFALALVLYALLTLRSRRMGGLSLPLPLLLLCCSLLCGALAAVMAFRFAGSYGLASYGGLVLLAYVASREELPGWGYHAVSGVAVVLVALAVNAHFSSRWVEPSYLLAILMAAGLVASYLLGLKLFRASGSTSEINRLFLMGGSLVLPMIISFALGGYQINDRATRVMRDLETRQNHWENVISSADSAFLHRLLGNGVGRFPGSFIGAHSEKVDAVGSFSISSEQRREILRLGGGHDLTIGQRVPIDPFVNYTVNVHLRADLPGKIVVGLCERNVIYASNFAEPCVRQKIKFEATGDAFQQYSLELNSGKVGERGVLRRWPTIVTLHSGKAGRILEIDAIELLSGGFNQLRNSTFEQGLDYWFFYNDFSHLPWHVKNTFLLVWFESGWLGLGLFLTLLGFMVRANFQHHAHDALIPVYTTAVIMLCVFGLFGSPLDSARVSWMFYFFLGAGLGKLRVGSKPETGNRVSHHPGMDSRS